MVNIAGWILLSFFGDCLMSIMTFQEYNEFEKLALKEQYRRNVSYYDPCKGWVLDLSRKINNIDLPLK